MTERTLVLVKPDGVQRLLTGRILARYEERGLKIVGLKLVQVDRSLAERHYDAHREKPFFGGLVDFITSGPLVAPALFQVEPGDPVSFWLAVAMLVATGVLAAWLPARRAAKLDPAMVLRDE